MPKKKLKKREFFASLLLFIVGGALAVVGMNQQKAERLLTKMRLWVESWEQRTVLPSFAREKDLPKEKDYLTFLQSLDLKYINPREILRPHYNKRYGVQNSLPPREMWQNIAATLKVADQLRQRLNSPLRVISVYRSPEYNSAINGASRSQHMQNRALDIRFDCSSREAFNMAEKLRSEGAFTGGIGYYSSFIHIDTRGINVSWGENS